MFVKIMAQCSASCCQDIRGRQRCKLLKIITISMSYSDLGPGGRVRWVLSVVAQEKHEASQHSAQRLVSMMLWFG